MTTDLDLGAHWHDAGGSDLWDRVELDGQLMPGIAEVDVSPARKIDTRSAPGSNGARLVDKGYEPAKVTIRLRVWTREQLAELQRVMPSLHFREERIPARTGSGPIPAETVSEGKARSQRQPRARDGVRRTRAAVPIAHPMAQMLGVDLVYVIRVESRHPSNGVLAVTLHCIEASESTATQSVTRAPARSTGPAFGDGVRTAFNGPSTGNTGPST